MAGKAEAYERELMGKVEMDLAMQFARELVRVALPKLIRPMHYGLENGPLEELPEAAGLGVVPRLRCHVVKFYVAKICGSALHRTFDVFALEIGSYHPNLVTLADGVEPSPSNRLLRSAKGITGPGS